MIKGAHLPQIAEAREAVENLHPGILKLEREREGSTVSLSVNCTKDLGRTMKHTEIDPLDLPEMYETLADIPSFVESLSFRRNNGNIEYTAVVNTEEGRYEVDEEGYRSV